VPERRVAPPARRRALPFEGIAEAHEAVESGRAGGRVVVDVG